MKWFLLHIQVCCMDVVKLPEEVGVGGGVSGGYGVERCLGVGIKSQGRLLSHRQPLLSITLPADETCLTLGSFAASHPGSALRRDTGNRDEILLGNKGNCFEKNIPALLRARNRLRILSNSPSVSCPGSTSVLPPLSALRQPGLRPLRGKEG